MKQIIHIILFISVIGACDSPSNRLNQKYDVIVYGGTPAGIIAAVTAADHGCEVLLVEQKSVLGGMYTSGLNTAESNHMINKVITGRARDFFVEMGEKFYDPAYFENFGNGRGLNFTEGDPAFFFESKHAKALFDEMILKNESLGAYDDYDWMLDHERYSKIYNRMYPDNKKQ